MSDPGVCVCMCIHWNFKCSGVHCVYTTKKKKKVYKRITTQNLRHTEHQHNIEEKIWWWIKHWKCWSISWVEDICSSHSPLLSSCTYSDTPWCWWDLHKLSPNIVEAAKSSSGVLQVSYIMYKVPNALVCCSYTLPQAQQLTSPASWD